MTARSMALVLCSGGCNARLNLLECPYEIMGCAVGWRRRMRPRRAAGLGVVRSRGRKIEPSSFHGRERSDLFKSASPFLLVISLRSSDHGAKKICLPFSKSAASNITHLSQLRVVTRSCRTAILISWQVRFTPPRGHRVSKIALGSRVASEVEGLSTV